MEKVEANDLICNLLCEETKHSAAHLVMHSIASSREEERARFQVQDQSNKGLC